MAALKNNKKCIVCGKVYTYCPNCAEFHSMPRWYGIFHGENCKNLYELVCDFDAGVVSKDEALERAMECDLTGMDAIPESMAKTIHAILGE